MDQTYHNIINWLDKNQMVTILEQCGFGVDSGLTDEIREELRDAATEDEGVRQLLLLSDEE